MYTFSVYGTCFDSFYNAEQSHSSGENFTRRRGIISATARISY